VGGRPLRCQEQRGRGNRPTGSLDAKRVCDSLFPAWRAVQGQCWTDTSLDDLEHRGARTGLPQCLVYVARSSCHFLALHPHVRTQLTRLLACLLRRQSLAGEVVLRARPMGELSRVRFARRGRFWIGRLDVLFIGVCHRPLTKSGPERASSFCGAKKHPLGTRPRTRVQSESDSLPKTSVTEYDRPWPRRQHGHGCRH
jgi:hypothetical protein